MPVVTSRWNLGSFGSAAALSLVGVLGAIGCSPTANEDGGGSTTGEDEVPECRDHIDCVGKGGYCSPNGICGDYCDESGCGMGEEPFGEECLADDDCPEGEQCRFGGCMPIPEPCRDIAMPAEVIELQFASGRAAPATALAFADVSPTPGIELLVARGGAIAQVDGTNLVDVVTVEGEIGAFAATDIDGDGMLDLVVAHAGDAGRLTTWLGDGTTFVATEGSQPLAAASALAVGAIRVEAGGDVVRGVIALSDGLVWGLPIEAGGSLAPPVQLVDLVPGPVTDLVVRDGVADAPAVLALLSNSSLSFAEAASSVFPESAASLGNATERLVPGDYSGDGTLDFAGYGSSSSIAVAVNPTVGAGSVPAAEYSLEAVARAVAAGDFDGDGYDDLAVTRPDINRVHLVFGATGASELDEVVPFECGVDVNAGFSAHAMAGADVDGDGVAELAVADDNRVLLVRW